MSKNLVIVESPAKAKTINKYLGKDFIVMASYGHVRDLLPKTGAVEPEHNFAMHYEAIARNAPHMDKIKKALKKADTLYLATDLDREGEAIAWHVYQILAEAGVVKNKAVHRIVFNEITRPAIQAAIEHPRHIDMNLVNAQQARRALDYLVGFNLSPLLWRKVRAGLSAGRVQSPALRLIVEREKEIETFVPQEYWSIHADCQHKQHGFQAKLVEYAGEKLKQFTITAAGQAEAIKAKLLDVANGKLIVHKVTKKLKKRNPAAPFITSTLQQEAARKLGFTAQRTMRIAQQLYEGVDIGMGSVGLITYMRTDSVQLAQEAIEDIRKFITKKYGKENLPEKPHFYRTKTKNAQEAHEAIRPTAIQQTPELVQHYLTADQYKLYSLIWKRTIASQMIHATINTVTVDLLCGTDNIFRATGSTIVHSGFISVYQEDDDNAKPTEEKELPPLQEGETVKLKDILCEQHFTEPPPRYSEASLVKALEEYGIGRPSTYANIISTLQQREYVVIKQKRFYPTDVGVIVNKFLTEYFTKYVDYDFTAKLEDDLDEISRGEGQWIPVLKTFWQPFKEQIDDINERVQRKDVTQELIDEKCPKCGKQLAIRLGKRGRFIGCTGYPECDYTRNLDGTDNQAAEPEVIEGRTCPKCGSALVKKRGRYGEFIGCSSYPECNFMEPLNKPTDTGVTCPVCHKGTLLKRTSRRGKIFYSCSEYPKCKYAIWNEPIAEKCPQCGWPILTLKITKRSGKEKVCPQENCNYSEQIEE